MYPRLAELPCQRMKQPDCSINSDRLLADFNELAEIGATHDGGVTRLALSNEDLQARAWFANRIEAAGLNIQDDDVGNLSGVLMCDNPRARRLLVGSHLDSVPNGGRFDGAVGVLAALECARTIQDAGIKLPFHLEIIDFTDEEGVWQSLFGSRGLTGNLSHNYVSDRDGDYGPFRAALFRAGIRLSDIHKAKRNPASVAGYLELHIEQGYRLDTTGINIGVVTGIVGRTTYEITFYGQASHSGTTETSRRRDALLGAATFITAANKVWRENYASGVLTCGNITVAPGSFNIIPAEARLTMECRSPDKDALAEMEAEMLRLAQNEAETQGLHVTWKRKAHMPAAAMSDKMITIIEDVCAEMNISHKRLVSYAGHDAQMMSTFTHAGMIFIPSVDGISHNPKEFTRWENVVEGANVLLHSILRLAAQNSKSRSGAGK